MKRILVLVCLVLLVCTACSNTEPGSEDLDVLFEELAQSSDTESAVLQTWKEERPDELLDYLMTCFLNGELETQTETSKLKFRVWRSMLGGEEIALETETMQEYWDAWCELAQRSCIGDGCRQQGRRVTHRYLGLLAGEPVLEGTYLDHLFIDVAETGTREDELERLLETRHDDVVVYLMCCFLNGSLEGCQIDDGSVGALQYRTWCRYRGNEVLESVFVSPQQDWEEWSSYAKRIYDLNGMDFLKEQDLRMNIWYVEALEAVQQ